MIFLAADDFGVNGIHSWPQAAVAITVVIAVAACIIAFFKYMT